MSEKTFINHGKFVISLDFELMWGVRDHKTIQGYGQSILGARKAVPELLKIFDKYGIKATFSTVGFLFFDNKKELKDAFPKIRPSYEKEFLSPYNYLDEVDENGKNRDYYFAPELIKEIKKYPEQEIGTHTFCHYYCLEPGQTLEEFKSDLEGAISIAKKENIELTSLVFPRNQFNEEYLKVCKKLGIKTYRGNEHSWLYRARKKRTKNNLRRAFRLMDAFINLSGQNCYSDEYILQSKPYNIPSSRMLREYSKKLSPLDSLKLNRIKSGMTHAAKNNLTFHLWWHPHNFGVNREENFAFLDKILKHYSELNRKYNFQSYTMSGLAESLEREKKS